MATKLSSTRPELRQSRRSGQGRVPQIIGSCSDCRRLCICPLRRGVAVGFAPMDQLATDRCEWRVATIESARIQRRMLHRFTECEGPWQPYGLIHMGPANNRQATRRRACYRHADRGVVHLRRRVRAGLCNQGITVRRRLRFSSRSLAEWPTSVSMCAQ